MRAALARSAAGTLRRLRVIAGGWGSVTDPPRPQSKRSRLRVLEGLGHARPRMATPRQPGGMTGKG